MTKRAMPIARGPHAVAVRTAMGHAIAHGFNQSLAGLVAAGLKAADNAAHKF